MSDEKKPLETEVLEATAKDIAEGQQKSYLVLSEAERAKGYQRPLRNAYTHDACGQTTVMHHAFAETYARDPGFYNATWCSTCRGYFPVGQFKWKGTDEVVGS